MATTTQTAFAALKLTTAKKPTQLSAVQLRRNKLSHRIWEQIQLAKAQQTGIPFFVTKSKSLKDAETGERVTVEQPKRLKIWWFKTEGGKLALNVRYGARVLALNSKGMTAIEVADQNELVSTLEVCKAAAENGELDAAIDAASGALRKGFGN